VSLSFPIYSRSRAPFLSISLVLAIFPLAFTLAAQPAVAAESSFSPGERYGSPRKGKQRARANIAKRSSGSGSVLQRYGLPPYRAFNASDDRWQVSQNWTLAGRSGIDYTPQRNAASSTSSVAVSPPVASYVPPSWSRPSRTSYYAVPVIIVCSVLLSLAIVFIILMSVVVRRTKASKARRAKLEDVERHEPKPNDDVASVNDDRDRLRSKIRRRFRKRRRRAGQQRELQPSDSTRDTAPLAPDGALSPQASSVTLNQGDRDTTLTNPSSDRLTVASSSPSASGRPPLLRNSTSTSTLRSTATPLDRASDRGVLSREASRQSLIFAPASSNAPDTTGSPADAAEPGRESTETYSEPQTSPPAYRPNSASSQPLQRNSGAGMPASESDLYLPSGYHERRPSYTTAVSGRQGPSSRSEEKRRAIDPPPTVEGSEPEEAVESSRAADFTAHVSTDDKAALGRLEGLASSAPPRVDEQSPSGPTAPPLDYGDDDDDGVWEDIPEDAMMMPPPPEPGSSPNASRFSSFPAPPIPFQSAFNSYAVGSTPSQPSSAPAPAEASAPPLNVFSDTDVTPSAPILPLYEPRQTS
jgi:hypothetical protein